MPLVPLQLMSRGETGRVSDIDGDESWVARLHEMGFRVGSVVRMLQPGSPCLVALDDQRFTFRGDEEALILIDVDPA